MKSLISRWWMCLVVLCGGAVEAQAACVWKQQSKVQRVGSCMLSTFEGQATDRQFSLQMNANTLDCGSWKLDFIARMKKRAERVCLLAKGKTLTLQWNHTIKVIRSWDHYIQLMLTKHYIINKVPSAHQVRTRLYDIRNGNIVTFAALFPQQHQDIWRRLQQKFQAKAPKVRKAYACSQQAFRVVQKKNHRYVRFFCYGKTGVHRDNFISIDVALHGVASSQPSRKMRADERAIYKQCAERIHLEFMQFRAWQAFLQIPARWFRVKDVAFSVGATEKARTLWYVSMTNTQKQCEVRGVKTGKVALRLAPGKAIPGCRKHASFILSYFAGHTPLVLLRLNCDQATRHIFLLHRHRKWLDMTNTLRPKMTAAMRQDMARLSAKTRPECVYSRVAFRTKPSRFALHMYAIPRCPTAPRVKIASYLWSQGRFQPVGGKSR